MPRGNGTFRIGHLFKNFTVVARRTLTQSHCTASSSHTLTHTHTRGGAAVKNFLNVAEINFLPWQRDAGGGGGVTRGRPTVQTLVSLLQIQFAASICKHARHRSKRSCKGRRGLAKGLAARAATHAIRSLCLSFTLLLFVFLFLQLLLRCFCFVYCFQHSRVRYLCCCCCCCYC